MKASIAKNYGPPEVLTLEEVEKPSPKANEVRVKIHASTVNRTDCGFRRPDYFIVRLINGFFKPRRKIFGTEFAGEVDAIGEKVSQFKIGDPVFGLNLNKFGTHAEYVCITENKAIALKPNNISYTEAAAVCDGLMMAITYLQKINFTTETKILINGASGSIGSAAVQLANYYGAHVTAVCNTRSADIVKSIGADEIINYELEDFTKKGKTYDVILDTVGKSSYFKCKKILKPGGIYFSSELGFLGQNIFLPLTTPLFSSRKVKFPIPACTQKDLEFFKALLESGNYKAVIDRNYSFDEIVEATRYVETGEKIGNVVIRITDKD
ncbi:MAG: NAD(P)-dependent alcohol dehydrogenase [Crocinitomicaceae bacterium]|nr:NAD(P)-dependent alcohol dehydrogenase [Crocinitomicaceae bacterium]